MSSSSCKCIKDLRLYEVSADNITIQSSSLESFSYVVHAYSILCNLSISGEKLAHIHIEWGFYKPRSRSLYISAPNLKTLKWFGRVLNHQELGELVCLEKAEILLEHKEEYKFDNVSEILGSISRTKALTLLEETVKVLLSERSMPSTLNNVSFLTLHVGCLNDGIVPEMVSLLSGMSNLNTLHISTHPSFFLDKPEACGFNKKFWESQNLAFIYQLNEVKIELCHGSNTVEFVFYILEHAQNLQKMVIYYLPHQSNLQQRVKKCKMASAPTIIFQKKVGEAKLCRLDACRYLTVLRNDRL
ncbi:PREDICTED: uncharacterized protein LOC101314767 [Fragaria vesca subsp. vesca]|uniref:uncharacterized protein LOC101314767 n=1 Tax=Fragaria vesca subsp. vesca TaxID=101020 RepID=UPI0002C367F5|nr:PREDICTED: uncharacterized protein LOC101314767 [Fragaria vesca subsp. vesca]